jgi:hypothetical protein
MKIAISGETYEYDPDTLLNTEAIALQRATGMRPPEFGKALELGDAVALTGLVWLIWRRNGRNVEFDAVEFDLADVSIEGDTPKGHKG